MEGVPEPPLDLATTPTPVERLGVLSDENDAELFVKRDDETAGVGQGNKIRKLEFLLGDALENDADTVVTCGGLQSNHCRTTAVVARRLGFDVHLVLLGEEPETYDGNLLLSVLAGATVEFVPLAEFSGTFEPELKDAAERIRDDGRDPYVIPLGGSNPRGSLGFVHAYDEIRRYADDNGTEFDRIVVALGSGGTCAGLVAGSLYAGDGIDLVGVDVTPYGEAYQRKNVVGTVQGISEILDRDDLGSEKIKERVRVASGYVGPGYGEPSEEDLRTVVNVGRKEGIVLDTTYTAKAFRYYLDTVEPDETSLFVHTGGSYGIFPHRSGITREVREIEAEEGSETR